MFLIGIMKTRTVLGVVSVALLLLLCLCPVRAQDYQYPFQDPTLSAHARALDLCSRLTLYEKSQLMMDISEPIDRLGVPMFIWWSEALHGVGRNGTCTVFPSCIGMAASFDDALVGRIFTAVSDEARAKNTAQRLAGSLFRYQGLSFWTPNINLFRDPRWGRGQETYGEDPYVNGRMGTAVVRGLQGPDDQKYKKLFACAKHFAVHSGPEKIRHNFNVENLSARDLYETYLPAFKTLVTVAGVKEVMCAYQRFEGAPCCGSERLLHQILRDEWGFEGLVVSDCGAVSDFFVDGRHSFAPDAASAVALAVSSGTDLECGFSFTNLPKAVREGKLTQEQMDASVLRLLEGRFELGDFDADSLVPWTSIPMSVVASEEHKALALEMAREQMVLLKNDHHTLPLSKDADIVVMGPNAADSVMLWGIYYGTPTHTVTILEGIESAVGREVPYVRGCDITSMTQSESIFNKFFSAQGAGMTGTFWNNTEMEGAPAYVGQYGSPLWFDNGGDTVFAPGVALTHFSAQFKGSFLADRDEVLDIDFSHDDGSRLIINGDTIIDKWSQREIVYDHEQLQVEKGKTYEIEIDYMQVDGGATMEFDVLRKQELTIDEVLAQVGSAQTVVFVGGITPALEREEARVSVPGFDGGDRTTIELPAVQRTLLQTLHEMGKTVILVNCSGGAVALTPEAATTCDAILQAWYPGEQGGYAVADVLFGDYNPCGKLPVTFYKDDSQLPPFDDYSMRGRTYRYFDGEPLYPFGYGLSYTSFALGEAVYDAAQEAVRVDVTNTGSVDGAEVVQLYVRYPADREGPRKTLRGWTRVALAAGQTLTVAIPLAASTFEWWDAATNTMRPLEGEYALMIGSSSADGDLQTIMVENKIKN